MIELALVAALAAAPMEKCSAMVRQDGALAFQPFPELLLLGASADSPLPKPPEHAVSIVCGRTSPVPAPFDYRIITDFEIPLFVIDEDIVGVLEMDDGQFRYRIVNGSVTSDDAAAVQVRLNEFQDRVQKSN